MILSAGDLPRMAKWWLSTAMPCWITRGSSQKKSGDSETLRNGKHSENLHKTMVLTRKYVRFGQIHFDLWILLRCNISHHVGAHQLVSSKSSVLDCHKNASSYFVFHLIGVVTTYTMYVCLYMVIHGIHIYICIYICVIYIYICVCVS